MTVLWCPAWTPLQTDDEPCDSFYTEATVTIYLDRDNEAYNRGDTDWNGIDAQCTDHDRVVEILDTYDEYTTKVTTAFQTAGFEYCDNCGDWTEISLDDDGLCQNCTDATIPQRTVQHARTVTARSAWVAD